MKKLFTAMMIPTLLLGNPSIALANQLHHADMSITVSENGIAHIKETWNATVDRGTELKKELYVPIKNLKVTDETGKEYINVGTWDIGSDRLKKYNSCGTQENLKGNTKIYFGTGDYGERAYILEYDVEEFICTDGNRTFTAFTAYTPTQNPMPEHSQIEIDLLDGLEFDIEGLYGFGYQGGMDITEDNLKVIQETYNDNGYTTLLLEYKDSETTVAVDSDKTFDELMLDLSNVESVMQKEEEPNKGIDTGLLHRLFITLLILIGMCIVLIKLRRRTQTETKRLDLPEQIQAIEYSIENSDEKVRVGNLEELNIMYLVYLLYGRATNTYAVLNSTVYSLFVKQQDNQEDLTDAETEMNTILTEHRDSEHRLSKEGEKLLREFYNRQMQRYIQTLNDLGYIKKTDRGYTTTEDCMKELLKIENTIQDGIEMPAEFGLLFNHLDNDGINKQALSMMLKVTTMLTNSLKRTQKHK